MEEDRQGHLNAAEVDEVAGEVMAAPVVVLLEESNGFLGASGAGEEVCNVLRRVPGVAFGVGSGPFNRLVGPTAAAISGNRIQYSSHSRSPSALGVEGVEVGQGVGRAPLVEAQIGEGVKNPVVAVVGVGLGTHHGDRFPAPSVSGQESRELVRRVRVQAAEPSTCPYTAIAPFTSPSSSSSSDSRRTAFSLPSIAAA